MPQDGQMPTAPAPANKIVVSETTWLEGIGEISSTDAPGNSKILTLTLRNGHRYAIPLSGQVLRHVQQAVSPIIRPGSSSLPGNGLQG